MSNEPNDRGSASSGLTARVRIPLSQTNWLVSIRICELEDPLPAAHLQTPPSSRHRRTLNRKTRAQQMKPMRHMMLKSLCCRSTLGEVLDASTFTAERSRCWSLCQLTRATKHRHSLDKISKNVCRSEAPPPSTRDLGQQRITQRDPRHGNCCHCATDMKHGHGKHRQHAFCRWPRQADAPRDPRQ